MIRFKKNLSAGREFYQFWGKTSNCYLLVDSHKDTTYLIDCGMPSDVPELLKILKKMPPLKRIVCTHFHVDHISGWIGLKKACSKAEIWFHEKARQLVTGQQHIPLPGYRAIKKILIPCMQMYGYRPNLRDIFQGGLYGTLFKKGFPQDRVQFFADGEKVLPGFSTLHTPGHRPDESSFLEPESGVFISGDFLLVLEGKIFSNTFVSSVEDQQTSLSKIGQRKEKLIICPGHGPCVSFSPHDL
jgi:glyoxylase-like metal-dependent hydrolase (beta-lactamase superfamily II)